MLWDDIKIDARHFPSVYEEMLIYKGYNPGCFLTEYWKDRINQEILEGISKHGKLAYGYVGDGWPYESNQDWALEHDNNCGRDLRRAFPEHHYRDVGDAIYQCNTILNAIDIEREEKFKEIREKDNIISLLKKKKKSEIIAKILNYKKLNIMDFGGGYGRLAIPFLYYLRGRVAYVSVDYVAVSLLISTQFVPRVCEYFFSKKDNLQDRVWGWVNFGHVYKWINDRMNLELPPNKLTYSEGDCLFLSLPTWRIDLLNFMKFHVFVSVHSFQEMLPESVEFYVKWAHDHAEEGAIFYSINLWPDYDYVPKSWELIYDKPYPINRDGSFNERIWRIK